jgi:predicted transposase/invertase (TIGR01784 family)
MTDHDSGYKLLFSHSRMVEEFFQGFIQEDWVKTLDFSTLERVGTSFVSDDLRERHSDMIWRVRSHSDPSRWFYVYLLLEFQSTPDPFMAVRLLGYIALLLSDLVRDGTATVASGLPTVLPIVLYNGKRPWTAPADLTSLFRSVPPGAERFLPQLTYLLVDENRLSPEELRQPGNRVASLFRLETCAPRDLPRLTEELAALLPRGQETGLRRAFSVWLLRLMRRLLPHATIPETADLEEMPMLEETLLEWFDGARQEGRKEGRQEGQIEGMRQLLLRVLEQRFGPLSQEARRKIGALASAQEIEALLGRALTSSSIDALGLGSPAS